MAKNIEPKLRKIGDYLRLNDDTVFCIPEYQRPYSWRVEHCDKLWSDIENFVANDSRDNYFFGTVIINCQCEDTRFSLIDGQQRTTTFLLLLKALLIRINNAIGKVEGDEDSEQLCRGLKERRRKIINTLYKTEAEEISDKPDRNKDKSIYSSINILENFSINEQYKTELNTILQSVDFEEAEQSVIKLPRKQKDNKYTNFFRNFKFFYEKTAEVDLSASQLNKITKAILENCEVIEIKSWQVEQAITMFNSLNSDGLPLYDSDIISAKMYAKAEEQGVGTKYSELWEKFLFVVKDIKERANISIDSILTQKMYYERAKNKEILNESGSINVTMPGLRRYFTEINKSMIENPIDTCEDLLRLSLVWREVLSYPAVQVALKFNENIKLFLSSFLLRYNIDSLDADKVVFITENLIKLFAILELVDTGYSSSLFKTFLFRMQLKLIDNSVEIEDIENEFNKHICNNWDYNAIKESITLYDKNILVYLNEYLAAKESNMFFSLDSKYDIEHILPMSGNNIQIIRNDAGLSDEDEFRNVVNRIGNKILLEEKINRSLGNDWFRTKIANTSYGYTSSRFPIALLLVQEYINQEKPYWTKDDIATATKIASARITSFIFT